MKIEEVKGVFILDAANNVVAYKKINPEEIDDDKLTSYIEGLLPNSNCVWAVITNKTKIDLNELFDEEEKGEENV